MLGLFAIHMYWATCLVHPLKQNIFRLHILCSMYHSTNTSIGFYIILLLFIIIQVKEPSSKLIDISQSLDLCCSICACGGRILETRSGDNGQCPNAVCVR